METLAYGDKILDSVKIRVLCERLVERKVVPRITLKKDDLVLIQIPENLIDYYIELAKESGLMVPYTNRQIWTPIENKPQHAWVK